jgi:phosphomannomutase/phosphomannomutase/phosphoglucomutase
VAYDNVIFREYDIRGIFNNQFDLDFVEHLGRAYASYHFKNLKINNPTIAVGYDARLSSPDIFKHLSMGLNASGFNVLNLGLVTTPISYFSTYILKNVVGSVMITGSHNPPDYNGFKICLGNSTIFGEEIQKIGKILQAKDFITGRGTTTDHDIFPAYIERYAKEFSHLKKVKVVLDCGNGTAGCVLRRLFDAINLEPTILFEKPDGNFPNHHPDPTVEKNLMDLKKAVIELKADVGIGFDGDADRIGLVDNTGRMIYGDELMTIVARDIIMTTPAAKIIGDVKCSDRFFKDIDQRGGQSIMWKTGHSLVKEKIKIEKAPFGGEMSGHVFFADRNYGYDDAIYAALRIIEIISKTGKTISQLLEGLPPAYNTPEIRIDTTEEKKVLIVEKLKNKFANHTNPDIKKVNLLDGIRVSYADGWALARASNTQPVLVLRFEAETEQRLNEIRSEFDSVVKSFL